MECDHCGADKNLILVDSDEKIYLCKRCNEEELRRARERFECTQKMFPSHDRARRIMKSWDGDHQDIAIDEKSSALPKWILARGLMNQYDFMKTRKELEEEVAQIQKQADRKNRSKFNCDLRYIKSLKKDLKKFRIEYFTAADVERLWRMKDVH